MKRNKLPLLLLALATGIFAFSGLANADSDASTPAEWMTDFEAATAKAKSENKPMLLDFTGSDWCGWCIKLDKEVFTKQSFVDYADANLVLVELDFPAKKEQTAELKAQNKALADKYKIRGYPTIVLLSSDGELIEKTGYRRGGPDKYVAHLRELLAAN